MQKCAVVPCILALAVAVPMTTPFTTPAAAEDMLAWYGLFPAVPTEYRGERGPCEQTRRVHDQVNRVVERAEENLYGLPRFALDEYLQGDLARCCETRDASICVDAETVFQTQITRLWTWLNRTCEPEQTAEEWVRYFHTSAVRNVVECSARLTQ